MQTQLVNFTIPKKILVQVDSLARKEARSRSELFREAIRSYLKEQTSKDWDFERIKQAATRINLNEKEAFRLVEKVRKTLPLNQ